MFPIQFPAEQTVTLTPDLWKACAGANVKVPDVDSEVYYFPEGHAEQFASSSPALAPIIKPMVRCRVIDVRLFSDRAKDDVFAVIMLQPILMERDVRRAPPEVIGGGLNDGTEAEGLRIVSYTKVLTQSDANCGGGFTVPKQCAVSFFPPLNRKDQDPPSQNLIITDLQGVNWAFRHIHGGTPLRHLFTTGWAKFVNQKKLVAGDTLVFMKDNLTGKLYVGIKHVMRGQGEPNQMRLLNLGAVEATGIPAGARFVEEAAGNAAHGLPFEVILHPWNGLPDFVVNADLVDRALSLRWAVGMGVKRDVADEGSSSSNPVCFQGNVSMLMIPNEGGQWGGSPWKMLQITWVGPQQLQSVERLSPWQVKSVEPGEFLLPILPLIEPRGSHIIQSMTETSREGRYLTGQELRSTMAQGKSGSLPHTHHLFNPDTHLTRVQGARHISDVSDLIKNDTNQMQSDDMLQGIDMSLLRSRAPEVYPEPESNPEVGSSLRNGNINSIQLFGKVIDVTCPVENQSDDAGCLRADRSQGTMKLKVPGVGASAVE